MRRCRRGSTGGVLKLTVGKSGDKGALTGAVLKQATATYLRQVRDMKLVELWHNLQNARRVKPPRQASARKRVLPGRRAAELDGATRQVQRRDLDTYVVRAIFPVRPGVTSCSQIPEIWLPLLSRRPIGPSVALPAACQRDELQSHFIGLKQACFSHNASESD
jgi:hypothetical protein